MFTLKPWFKVPILRMDEVTKIRTDRKVTIKNQKPFFDLLDDEELYNIKSFEDRTEDARKLREEEERWVEEGKAKRQERKEKKEAHKREVEKELGFTINEPKAQT